MLPWALLACALAAIAMAVYTFRYEKDRYLASFTFYALPATVERDEAALQLSRMAARDCDALLDTQAFRDAVLSVAPSDGACRVNAQSVDGTHVIELTVVGEDADIACGLANAAGRELMLRAGDTLGMTQIAELQAATVPLSPCAPDRPRKIALAGSIAFAVVSMLGLFVGSNRERLRFGNGSLKRAKLPFMGAIPDARPLISRQQKAILQQSATLYEGVSPRMAESLRALVLRLRAAEREGEARSVVVTSLRESDDKAALALLLSSALAEQRFRVLLIDLAGDRQLSRLIGVRGTCDLFDYLRGSAAISETLVATPVRNLTFMDDLHAGNELSRVGATRSFGGFLTVMRKDFDYILLNVRAAGSTADAGMAGLAADLTLLACENGKYYSDQLKQTVDGLARVVKRMMGVVLTRVPDRKLPAPHKRGQQ